MRTKAENNMALIEVTDTGNGIPDKVRQKIFDPFFTTKPVGIGTGQGLSLAHRTITRTHGGTISFTTQVGKGTTFHVCLPLNPPDMNQT